VSITTLNLYQAQDSFVHDLDPRVKVVLTILVIVSNVLLPDGTWLAFAGTWLLLLGISWIARIQLKFLLIRSSIILPFSLAAVTTIFTTPGDTLAAPSFLPTPITLQGVTRFGSIMLRSWLSVQAALLLSATTQFPDLIHALRHLKIPSILVSIVSFMYRYLFVLTEEVQRLMRARASRSAKLPGQKSGLKPSQNVRMAGSLIGQLFLRSIERSERIYQAMQVRGYRGHLLTLNPHVMRGTDWLTFSLFLLVLTLIQIGAHL
jgi:cobalt/nickel transport system permease protein